MRGKDFKRYKHDEHSSRDHHFEKRERRHSDGYKKAGDRNLDLKVAAGDIQRNPELLPLASKPATATDLDLWFKETHEVFHNGGYTNILTQFKQVDARAPVGAERTMPQSVPDYINATINYLAPAYYNTEYSNFNSDNNSFQAPTQQTVQVPDQTTSQITQATANLSWTWPAMNDQNNGGVIIHAYRSYMTRRNYDRNQWFQWLYNKFANNANFSGIAALHPGVYSLNDTSPMNIQNATMGPYVNTLMAQWDAVNANMLYLVLCLKQYKITKVLLNKFADRHNGLSGYISQAVSGISTLHYIKLLDNAADLLSGMPCDCDYIENYSKRIIPSLSGSSYYDPILIPHWYLQIPQYQIQFEGGNPFTPWCENVNYTRETSINTLSAIGYNFQVITQGMTDPETIQVPAGYQIVVDDNNNLYYYYTAPQGSNLPTGWYRTGYTAPYAARVGANVKLKEQNTNIEAQTLLNNLQNLRNNPASTVADYENVIQTFRNNWMTYLQTLVDNIARLNLMMAPFASLYQLIENSGLAKYHAKRWEWDFDITAHYDGWVWDWIKHPEACILPINNVANTAIQANTGYINAHNQYAAGIGMRYDKYDEHIIDSNAMYSVVAEWYYCTTQTNYYGNTMYITPFTDYQNGQNTQVNANSFDANGISLNTYMLPKATITDLVYVSNYYGDRWLMQVTDRDTTTLQCAMSLQPTNDGNNLDNEQASPYPQAWVPVGIYDTDEVYGFTFSYQYLLRFLGVIGYTNTDADDPFPVGTVGQPANLQLGALFTDGLTSYLPLTIYNDIAKYYDETVSEHPFTVVTRPNAQKVLQVAN